MNTRPVTIEPTPLFSSAPPTRLGRLLLHLRNRLVGGLMLLLPIAITFWILRWGYLTLEENVIDPVATLVIWKAEVRAAGEQIPYWFKYYVAPAIAVVIILVSLYLADLLANTRYSGALSWVLTNVPIVSMVYSPVRKVFQALEKPQEAGAKQRCVLVQFPHPGMKVPAFVTARCRDVETSKVILCVYVPTTPVPTSGYFLLVPEDEVVELNWTSEQTMEAIISAGLTSPPFVQYLPPSVPGYSPFAPPVVPPAVPEPNVTN